MGTRERRETDKKKMQGLILRTALKLFIEKGFENVSIRRIAGKIQYSPATIYLYYKGKDEILCALHDFGFEKLYAKQQTILSIKDPYERLRKQGRVYVEFALENPELYDLMFIMRGPAKKIREQEEWETGLRSYGFLRDNVQACIDAGYLKQVHADEATFAFWSLTHGVVSLIIRDRCIMFPEEHRDDIVKGALAFIMDSIGAGKA